MDTRINNTHTVAQFEIRAVAAEEKLKGRIAAQFAQARQFDDLIDLTAARVRVDQKFEELRGRIRAPLQQEDFKEMDKNFKEGMNALAHELADFAHDVFTEAFLASSGKIDEIAREAFGETFKEIQLDEAIAACSPKEAALRTHLEAIQAFSNTNSGFGERVLTAANIWEIREPAKQYEAIVERIANWTNLEGVMAKIGSTRTIVLDPMPLGAAGSFSPVTEEEARILLEQGIETTLKGTRVTVFVLPRVVREFEGMQYRPSDVVYGIRERGLVKWDSRKGADVWKYKFPKGKAAGAKYRLIAQRGENQKMLEFSGLSNGRPVLYFDKMVNHNRVDAKRF